MRKSNQSREFVVNLSTSLLSDVSIDEIMKCAPQGSSDTFQESIRKEIQYRRQELQCQRQRDPDQTGFHSIHQDSESTRPNLDLILDSMLLGDMLLGDMLSDPIMERLDSLLQKQGIQQWENPFSLPSFTINNELYFPLRTCSLTYRGHTILLNVALDTDEKGVKYPYELGRIKTLGEKFLHIPKMGSLWKKSSFGDYQFSAVAAKYCEGRVYRYWISVDKKTDTFKGEYQMSEGGWKVLVPPTEHQRSLFVNAIKG